MGPVRFVAMLGILAWMLSAAPAGAQAPFDSPGKTDRIEYVTTTTTTDGYSWDLYRNLAYPCSISGYQTFAVGTREGSSPTEPRPLWVRMRGGGVGYFSTDGQPQPSAGNKTESDVGVLTGFVEENALNQLINAEPANFRDLSVSMCDHDIYAGGDQPDPNNPNVTPDGRPRTTNGLFATKAAIQFVQDRYPTTKTFLHGTSAGSFGSWGLAWSLQRQDRPVAGFVADSGVLNLQSELDQQAAGTRCARTPEALAAIGARIHPELADPANQPDLLIARGDLTAPAFNVWNRDDSNGCGTEQIACTMPDGSTQVMGAMECRMDRVSKAIAALPASSHSRTMRLCVRSQNGPPGTCTRHVVTNPTDFPNTDPAFPADYNAVIVNWVRERLDDRPPALDVGFGKRSELAFARGRGHVRCKSGGYEDRTCRVRLRARRNGTDRVVARGERRLAKGAGSAKVTLKLTPRGRSILQRAPRRGIRVKAQAEVEELYTARAGEARRRLRVR